MNKVIGAVLILGLVFVAAVVTLLMALEAYLKFYEPIPVESFSYKPSTLEVKPSDTQETFNPQQTDNSLKLRGN